MAHTPGPWTIKISDPDRFGMRYWVDSEKGNFICECVRNGKNESANAALIAAAPDLLEACKAVNTQLDAWWRVLDSGKKLGDISAQIADLGEQVAAAIAKAEPPAQAS